MCFLSNVQHFKVVVRNVINFPEVYVSADLMNEKLDEFSNAFGGKPLM